MAKVKNDGHKLYNVVSALLLLTMTIHDLYMGRGIPLVYTYLAIG